MFADVLHSLCPVYSLTDGDVHWPKHGILPPADFVPLMAQAHPEDHHIKVRWPREASYLLPPPTHTALEDLRTSETQRRGR